MTGAGGKFLAMPTKYRKKERKEKSCNVKINQEVLKEIHILPLKRVGSFKLEVHCQLLLLNSRKLCLQVSVFGLELSSSQ